MNELSPPTLGSRLEQARQDTRLSLRDLVRATGASLSMVNRLLKDEIDRPAPGVLVAMGEALGVSAAELFRLACYPYPDVEDVLRTDHGLSDQAVTEVRTLISELSTREGTS